MNYDLAKQLKDAGFPVIEYADRPPQSRTYCVKGCSEPVYVPTLSELIEACGDEFISLSKMGDKWYCTKDGSPVRLLTYESDIPEEAVAKLWLELNKKES